MDLRPDGTFRGWADRLAEALAARNGTEGLRYANLAIRGRLLPRVIDEQLPAALELRPSLISLWAGGNDMLRPGSDPDALASLVEDAVVTLRREGIDVLIGNAIDAGGSPVLELTRNKAAVYSSNVWTIARNTGAHVLDVWGLHCLKDPRMWADDRIHFSSEGHRRVADAALVGLGQQPLDPHWQQPLPAIHTGATRIQQLRENSHWAREHMLPWVARRIRGTSSGADRTGKRPELQEVVPGSAGADDAAPRDSR
jgi:lysophospholipase L1-like esterase